MDFDKWMNRVDAWCYQIAGLSVYDLPDCAFRRWWEQGKSPEKAARKALKKAGGEF
jgi:hypothetical protein